MRRLARILLNAATGVSLVLCTMVGAVLIHLLKIGGSPAPALVLGLFAAVILWGRFGVVKAWPATDAGGSAGDSMTYES